MAALPKAPTSATTTAIDRLVATVDTDPARPTLRMSRNSTQRSRVPRSAGRSRLRGDRRYSASTRLPTR